MSDRNLPILDPVSGFRFQSGTPKTEISSRPLAANGLLLRGVVVATYVTDDEDHPEARRGANPAAVFADVLVLSSMPGLRWRVLAHCEVAQGAGIHSGHIWLPRAATVDIATSLDPDGGSNPANWDGDHVLVGFLDDQLNQPIVLGQLTHPSADQGTDRSDHRRGVKIKQIDGLSDFRKHHGSWYGVDEFGSLRFDTRFANGGDVDDAGREPRAPVDGRGDVTFKLPLDGDFEVYLDDMGTAPAEGNAPDPAPSTKVKVQITRDFTRIEYADAGPLLVIDNSNGEFRFFQTDGSAGDALVLESKAQAEYTNIRAAITNLSDLIMKMQYAMPMYIPPLIPNPGKPLDQCIPPSLLYGPEPQNIVLGEAAKLSTGPIATDASVPGSEYDPTLLPDGGNPDETASERVKVDK